MKRYELLGYGQRITPELRFDLKLQDLDAETQQLRGHPGVDHRRAFIRNLLIYPCWRHMQFVSVPDVQRRIEEGLAQAIDYFHNDWWTAESVRRFERETPELLRLDKAFTVDNLIEYNARIMDRSQPESEFRWREELRSGIIFGGLLEKWEGMAQVASALDASVQPEYSAGTIVEEYFQWYLCVAGRLSGNWTAGMESLLESVKNCRLKRLSQVVAAWEAAVAGDQGLFNKTFTEAVKSFVKRKEDPSEFMWVALDETVIWLIARRNGLSFPDMPDKLKAAVMTRESLALT